MLKDLLQASTSVDEPKQVWAEIRTKLKLETSTPAYRITFINKFLTWLSPYRKLLISIFSLNLVGVVLVLCEHWPWVKSCAATLAVGNILVALIVRSEWLLRFWYWLCVKILRPQIFPLWVRVQVVGILFHIGKFFGLMAYQQR